MKGKKKKHNKIFIDVYKSVLNHSNKSTELGKPTSVELHKNIQFLLSLDKGTLHMAEALAPICLEWPEDVLMFIADYLKGSKQAEVYQHLCNIFKVLEDSVQDKLNAIHNARSVFEPPEESEDKKDK